MIQLITIVCPSPTGIGLCPLLTFYITRVPLRWETFSWDIIGPLRTYGAAARRRG